MIESELDLVAEPEPARVEVVEEPVLPDEHAAKARATPMRTADTQYPTRLDLFAEKAWGLVRTSKWRFIGCHSMPSTFLDDLLTDADPLGGRYQLEPLVHPQPDGPRIGPGDLVRAGKRCHSGRWRRSLA